MRVDRRTAVVGALAWAGALAACDTTEVDLPGLPRLGDHPDRDLVRAALRSERDVLALVSDLRRRHRALRRPLAGTVAVHTVHVQLLAETVGDREDRPARRTRISDRPAQALSQLSRTERALGAEHVRTALRASSGEFARVVASMSAAAAQQSRLVLDLDPAPGGRR